MSLLACLLHVLWGWKALGFGQYGGADSVLSMCPVPCAAKFEV